MGQDDNDEDFVQVVIDLPLSILVEVGKAAKKMGCSTEAFISSSIFASLVKCGQIEITSIEECDEDGNPVAHGTVN